MRLLFWLAMSLAGGCSNLKPLSDPSKSSPADNTHPNPSQTNTTQTPINDNGTNVGGSTSTTVLFPISNISGSIGIGISYSTDAVPQGGQPSGLLDLNDLSLKYRNVYEQSVSFFGLNIAQEEKKKVIVTVKDTGETSETSLQTLGLDEQSSLVGMDKLPNNRFLFKGSFNSGAAKSNVLLVEKSGDIGLLPENVPSDFTLSAGKVWYLSGGQVFVWNPESKLTTTITDSQLSVSKFFATSDGALIIQGVVKTTNASFSRLIKNNGSSFELIEFVPDSSELGVATKAVPQIFNGFFPSSTAIFEFINNSLLYFLAPWSQKKIVAEMPSENSQRRLVLETVQGAAGPLAIATFPMNDVLTNKPSWFLAANAFDKQSGIYFDGLNLVQIEFNAGKLNYSLHKTIKFNRALGFRVLKIFGPSNGFLDVGLAIIAKQDSTDLFIANFNADSGIVDVDSRYRLYLSGLLQTIDLNSVFMAKVSGNVFVTNFSSGAWSTRKIESINLSQRRANLSTSVEGFDLYSSLQVVNDEILINKGHIELITPSSGNVQSLGYCGTTGVVGSMAYARTFILSPDSSKLTLVCGDGKIYQYSDWRSGLGEYNATSSSYEPSLSRTTLASYFTTAAWDEKALVDKNGAFVLRSDADQQHAVAASPYASFVDSVPAFKVGNPVEYFGSEFSAVEIVRPISMTKIFYSGIADGDYRSYVYDSLQKSATLVDALNGIQVYQAISSGQIVFINGLDLSKNQISNFVLDVATLLVKAEVENSSQVLALETVDYSPSEP